MAHTCNHGNQKNDNFHNISQQAWKGKQEHPETFKKFVDVFQQKDTDGLLLSCVLEHAIQVKESFTPCCTKGYPLNRTEMKVCKAFIDEHLKKG